MAMVGVKEVQVKKLPKFSEETYKLVEILVCTGIFFTPNIIFLFIGQDSKLWLLYNFIIMFLMSSALAFRGGGEVIRKKKENFI